MSELVHEYSSYELRGSSTCQDEVERAGSPFMDRFLSVFGDVELDFFLFHEGGQDRLVNGVI